VTALPAEPPAPSIGGQAPKEPTPDEALQKARDEEKALTSELEQKRAQLQELQARCHEAKGRLIKALAAKVELVSKEMQTLQDELEARKKTDVSPATGTAAPKASKSDGPPPDTHDANAEPHPDLRKTANSKTIPYVE
jgi:hypothetical protein